MLFFVDARIEDGADIEPLLQAEVAAVKVLHTEGFIERLWRREDGTGAYLIVTADSLESAQSRLDALPFPENGLMKMQVEPVELLYS
jgi:muconolactone delta-isomerase